MGMSVPDFVPNSIAPHQAPNYLIFVHQKCFQPLIKKMAVNQGKGAVISFLHAKTLRLLKEGLKLQRPVVCLWSFLMFFPE